MFLDGTGSGDMPDERVVQWLEGVAVGRIDERQHPKDWFLS